MMSCNNCQYALFTKHYKFVFCKYHYKIIDSRSACMCMRHKKKIILGLWLILNTSYNYIIN